MMKLWKSYMWIGGLGPVLCKSNQPPIEKKNGALPCLLLLCSFYATLRTTIFDICPATTVNQTHSLGFFRIATSRASSDPSGGWKSYLKVMSGGAMRMVDAQTHR